RNALAKIIARAKATSWVSDAKDAISGLMGGLGAEAFNGDFVATAHGSVQMDGEVHTGLTRHQVLVIDNAEISTTDPGEPGWQLEHTLTGDVWTRVTASTQDEGIAFSWKL